MLQKVSTFPRTSPYPLLLPSIRRRHLSRLSLLNRIVQLGDVFFSFFFLLSLIKYLSLTVLGISFARCSFVPTFLELVTHLLVVTFCICPEAYPFESHFASIPQYIHNNWSLRLESNSYSILLPVISSLLTFVLFLCCFYFFLYGSLLTYSGYDSF